jgi:hypothetical protein
VEGTRDGKNSAERAGPTNQNIRSSGRVLLDWSIYSLDESSTTLSVSVFSVEYQICAELIASKVFLHQCNIIVKLKDLGTLLCCTVPRSNVTDIDA